jgi:hypothetical protein
MLRGRTRWCRPLGRPRPTDRRVATVRAVLDEDEGQRESAEAGGRRFSASTERHLVDQAGVWARCEFPLRGAGPRGHGHGQALMLADTRFPRLTEPGTGGLTVPAGGSASVAFSIAVPVGIEPSHDASDAVLFSAPPFAEGRYLHRTAFVVGVV